MRPLHRLDARLSGRGPALESSELEPILALGDPAAGHGRALRHRPGPRRRQVSDKDRLELAGSEFHARVRDGFLQLAAADPDAYLVLPALADIRETATSVRDRVAALLGRDLVGPPVEAYR